MDTADEPRKPDLSLTNILFAMDFSADCLRALPYAVGIALQYGGKVFVAHIIPAQDGDAAPLKEQLSLETLMADSMQTGLNNNLLGSLREVPHEIFVDHGDVCARLLAAVDNCNIDLVVIGTHGWQGIKKLWNGSIAEQIARLATRPVLTVGPGASRRLDFKQILYATDFTPPSIGALLYAASLAQSYGAHLLVVHVNDCDRDETPIEAAPKTSEFVRQHLTGYGANVTPENATIIIDFGPRADLILEHATRRQVDLIVMGLHHLGGIKARIASHLHGSASYKVVSEAPCPVLLVPQINLDSAIEKQHRAAPVLRERLMK